MALKYVTGKLTDSFVGTGGTLIVTLSQPALIAGTQEVVNSPGQIVVAADGTYTFQGQANSDLTPGQTYYNGEELGKAGGQYLFTFQIPQTTDSGGHAGTLGDPFRMANLIVVAPAPLFGGTNATINPAGDVAGRSFTASSATTGSYTPTLPGAPSVPTPQGVVTGKVWDFGGAGLNAAAYNVKADGVTDDSAAMNAAIAAALISRQHLMMPPGAIYCGSTLAATPPGASDGWKLTGAGSTATVLNMAANTPALNLLARADQTGLNSAYFADFGITWPAPSGAGNTLQVGVLFKDTRWSGPTWFSNTFERIRVTNSYDAWQVTGNGGQSPSVWNTHWRDVQVWNCQRHVWNLAGPTPVGQPICTWRDCFVNNASGSVVSTGYIWNLSALEAHMSGMDLEGWYNQILAAGGGGFSSLEDIHIEHHTIDSATSQPWLFVVDSQPLTINGLSITGTSFGGGSLGFNAIAVANNYSSVGSNLSLDRLQTGVAAATGGLYAFYKIGGSGVSTFRLGTVVTSNGVAATLPSGDAATAALCTGIDNAYRLGSGHLLFGSGVPAVGVGVNGDWFLRSDGGGAGATHLYFKNTGAWLGIA